MIINGEVLNENVTFGELVHFKCNPGFEIIGPDTITCLQNNTNNPPPYCEGNSLYA